MRVEDLIDPLAPADGPPPRTLLAFLRWGLKGGMKVTGLGAAVSMTSGVLEVLSALILGWLIDIALASDGPGFFASNIWLLLGVLVFFVGLRPAVLGLSGLMQSVVIGPSLFNLVLSRLHRYTLGQDVTFFDNDFAGRISQKQMQAARAVSDLAIDTIQTVFFALASLIGTLILLFAIDGWTATLLILWALGYGAFIRYFLPRIRTTAKERAATRAMVTGQVVDTITNIKTVKLFAHHEHEDRAALNAMTRFREASLAFGWVSASFRFWLMALAGTLPVMIVGATLYFWTLGQASAGDIAAAGTVSLRLAQMTGWVSFTLIQIYSNIGEVEDAVVTLTPRWALTDADGARDLAPGQDIAFREVTFTYGRESGGVHDIDLYIAKGEKLGLVGASGAGKSTLVSLLLRLYDPEAGRIEIGGQNIASVTQESLRRRIGMVTQETAMFNRSAADNIRYGNPDASDDEVIAAARKAEAHDFIGELKDFRGRTGYDAHLGERGVKLSGGQRQRIALARAMLKDAPILVLDEATSALDSEVEAQIQDALEVAMRGKSVIAIAHRLSTLSSMDRIVVVDGGQIVEEGSHTDLLAQGGLYARYWNRQSGGFIRTDDLTAAE